MPRPPDSGYLNLHQVFLRLQNHVLTGLNSSRLIEHASTAGADAELHWLDLLRAYLPSRFRASRAFILNSRGLRSRQIDLAIYDHLTVPPLFPYSSAPHIPIESVYAVFEIKPTFSKQWLRDAAEKIASVRSLASPKKRPVLAGLLATSSVWTPKTFTKNLTPALLDFQDLHRLNLGCALEHGAFDHTTAKPTVSPADQALAFFLLRLIHHLNRQPKRSPPNLLAYLETARTSALLIQPDPPGDPE